jgi:hypothetical protein
MGPVVSPIYASNCNYVNITNSYPTQVSSGDRIRIVSTITLNCNSGLSNYEGQASILDNHGVRLTGARFYVGPISFNVDTTTQVTNWIIAPTMNGTLMMTTHVDLYPPTIGTLLGVPVYSNESSPIVVQVGAPLISTTTTSQMSESPGQSAVTMTFTTTMSSTILILHSITIQVQESSSHVASLNAPSRPFYTDIRVWLIAVLLIALAIVLRIRALTLNERK